jgi:hypothetical protein
LQMTKDGRVMSDAPRLDARYRLTA